MQNLPWHFILLMCIAALIIGFAIGAACIVLIQLKGMSVKKKKGFRFKHGDDDDNDDVFDYRAAHPGESYTYVSEAAKNFKTAGKE